MTERSLPLFYKSPRVLVPGEHRDRSLAEVPTYRFAATTNAVPIVAEEMALVARHFPIVFSQEASPFPLAVVGVRSGQNLFVDAEGRWRDSVYVPAYVRRYPFIFIENEGATELTLCVDEAAETVVAGRANPFFDEKDEPTQLTRSALAFCRDYQGQHRIAAEFGAAVAAAGLLIEHRADITLNHNGEKLSVSGFQVIDERKFESLPDETLLAWRKKGWLPLVYSHFFSIGAWQGLIDRVVAG